MIPPGGTSFRLNSVTYHYDISSRHLLMRGPLAIVHPCFSERHYIYSARNHIQTSLILFNKMPVVIIVPELVAGIFFFFF